MKKKKILFGTVCVGLGVLSLIFCIKNSKLREENRILKENLSDCNDMLDKKNMTIGKLVTEMRTKFNR